MRWYHKCILVGLVLAIPAMGEVRANAYQLDRPANPVYVLWNRSDTKFPFKVEFHGVRHGWQEDSCVKAVLVDWTGQRATFRCVHA